MHTVVFRDFEKRDVSFIHRCKNDEKLNSLIVGNFHPFSMAESMEWVNGCMGEHDTFKFWAICTNDDDNRIVGWVSISEIDYVNSSACFHGIVIGDENYRDGLAWIESYLFIYDYVFNKLGLNRLYGSNIEEQKASYCMALAMFERVEGIARQSVFKDGRYHNVVYASILKDEYLLHKQRGDFAFNKIVYRLNEARKSIKDSSKFK